MNIGLHSTEMKTWMENLWKEKAKPVAGEETDRWSRRGNCICLKSLG